MPAPHHLYIHVPFCASKCNYCAFYSVACDAPDWNNYAAQIIGEIKYWAERIGRAPMPTIFFGGGTPSLMPTDTFARIMDAVRENFDVAPDAETTLESNPGTIDAGRLREFQRAGVNRLSVGVQSFDDDVLQFLGRRHSSADARRLIAYAADSGMRASGDFIYATPGQTVRDVENMCRGILDMGLRHASLYELSIEPGTPFAAQKIQSAPNDTAAEMYQVIGGILSGALSRYEVSNYAEHGNECRHNSGIWDGEAYIGVGDGAAGRVFIDGQWYETKNENSTRNVQLLSVRDRAIEKIITGLRTARGVHLSPDVHKVINWDFVENNKNLFSLSPLASRLSLSEKGLLILDNLLVRLTACDINFLT